MGSSTNEREKGKNKSIKGGKCECCFLERARVMCFQTKEEKQTTDDRIDDSTTTTATTSHKNWHSPQMLAGGWGMQSETHDLTTCHRMTNKKKKLLMPGAASSDSNATSCWCTSTPPRPRAGRRICFDSSHPRPKTTTTCGRSEPRGLKDWRRNDGRPPSPLD